MRSRLGHAALAAACCFWALTCEGFTSADDRAVAIQVDPLPDSILVNDTVEVHARALNRAGDSIPGALIVLIGLNPDTLGVDSARVAIFGVVPGTGRFVARTGNIPSTVLLIPVR